MPIVVAMAEPSPSSPRTPREPGAPIAPDEVDPELIKLARTRPRVGLITAAGIVALCVVLLVRLTPDRRFAGASATPTPTTVADASAGRPGLDQLVAVPATPLFGQAIRVTKAAGTLGLRLVPVDGSGDRLWLALPGASADTPVLDRYVGRLRRLDDLPFATAARAWAQGHPRPVFATAAAARTAFTTGALTTVGGVELRVTDGARVAVDLVEPAAATVIAALFDRLPDAAAWTRALADAHVPVSGPPTVDSALGQVRFSVGLGATAATTRLEAANLFAARVEPVTRHVETTWGALRASPPAGLALGGDTVADAQIEVLGVHALGAIPDDALVVVTGELPEDYWYVPLISLALLAFAVLFAWALVRAVRRDLLAPRAP